MKVFQLHEKTQKLFSKPSPDPKNSPLGPQKVKNDHKTKSKLNQMSELKVTSKMKVVQLHEETQKQFLDHSPTPKIAR